MELLYALLECVDPASCLGVPQPHAAKHPCSSYCMEATLLVAIWLLALFACFVCLLTVLARCIHSGALVCDVLVLTIHSAALACDVVVSSSGDLQARAVKNQEFNSVPPCESRGFLPY